jgi:hypothetical protein
MFTSLWPYTVCYSEHSGILEEQSCIALDYVVDKERESKHQGHASCLPYLSPRRVCQRYPGLTPVLLSWMAVALLKGR